MENMQRKLTVERTGTKNFTSKNIGSETGHKLQKERIVKFGNFWAKKDSSQNY